MQTIEDFLRALWPVEGNKAIVSIDKNKGIDHYWFAPDEIQEAAAMAANLSSRNLDTYFALAGYRGNTRKADNVVALRALWLDLDVGQSKDYPTRSAAGQALGQFIRATALPNPVIVISGNGLHVYWPLDEDMPYAEWRVMADNLKDLCKQHGLLADLKCTADAARILRPVQTYNFKNGQPLPVKLANGSPTTVDVATVKAVLGWKPTDPFAALAVGLPSGAAGVDAVGMGDAAPADFNIVLNKCATIKWMYENQEKVSEPDWYDALGVAAYCSAPGTAAHRLSSAHPQYDPLETDRKLRQRTAAAGPTTCARLRSGSNPQCTGCTHTVTTPVQLGRPALIPRSKPVATATGSTRYAHPWIKLDNTGFYVRMTVDNGKDKDGGYKWVKVSEYGLTPLMELRQTDAHGHAANYIWLEAYNHHGETINSFIVPSQGVTNSMQFSNDCAKQGFYLFSESATHAYKKFHEIMRTWIEQMKRQQGPVLTLRSFGWIGADSAAPDTVDSFLLGNKLYTPNGEHVAPYTPTLEVFQKDMVSKGTLEEWRDAFDKYSTPGLEAQMFALWCAWGSPLMRFTSSGTAIFHVLGKTGVGKSSLQRALLSVYGDYNSKQLLDVNTSTLNSMGKTMGIMNSLPYCKEEVAEADAAELASWALTATQGREKQRMNQNNGIAQVSTWSLLALTSSNISLREIIMAQRPDSAARLARIWEQEISLPMKQYEASEIFLPLRHNYGHAGAVFIRYIVKHRNRVAAMVREAEATLSKRLKAEGGDRFHISLMAANFVGASIAMELGLHNHDLSRGMNYAVQQYRRLHTEAAREALTPEQNLARFIQDMQPHTLVVEVDVPGTATTQFDSSQNILRNVSSSNPITLRYAKSNSMLYASTSVMRRYYADNHINFETDMNYLQNAGILTARHKRVVLTKGTALSDNKQVYAMHFDLSKSTELVEVTP